MRLSAEETQDMEEVTTERERDSPGSEPMIQQPETAGAREPENAALIPKCITDKKYPLAAAFIITILLIIIIALAARKPQPCPSCPSIGAACPDRWVGYQGKCYNASEDKRNWTESENRCSSFGASLAVIDTIVDLEFLTGFTRPHHYWIGLSREEGKAWRWPNGTEFNNLFTIRGEGQCAYLNDLGISSTRCFLEKNLLCSQPDANTKRRKPNLAKRGTNSTST
ncbi:C-type lectin domain family 2 member D-like isoform X2 [Hemicordylus capensis]|uniref:C-type lectin domain family 2 member D-like isoform X2 n=1 Tax=Hemicordylus capensis TaxID=884348 RepID=UPI002304B26D|nr:C-type lectin domain family 2 member D-like isoform X2 [Hemicordylus capensis]